MTTAEIKALVARTLAEAKRDAKLARRVVIWVATFHERVQHAHVRNGFTGPARLCKAVLVMDPEHWRKTKPQPTARCVRCTAILVEALAEDGAS